MTQRPLSRSLAGDFGALLAGSRPVYSDALFEVSVQLDPVLFLATVEEKIRPDSAVDRLS
jgi:hypothetical protein